MKFNQQRLSRGGRVITPTQQKIETLGEFHLLPPRAKCLYCGIIEEATFGAHAKTRKHMAMEHHSKFHPPGPIANCSMGECRLAYRTGVVE